MGMLRNMIVALAVTLLPLQAMAQEVEAVFSVPPDFADLPVTWSATPLDLPPEADPFQAMIFEDEARAGPWIVTLAPGTYLVSAFSATEVFELSVAVAADMGPVTVPPLELGPAIPFRCAQEKCDFVDPVTGLRFSLPMGWAAEQPYHADLGDGLIAPEVSAVFFEDRQDDGSAVWFLNPLDWFVDENGPCRDVSLGSLCTFEVTQAAEDALSVIAPSLAIEPRQ